MGTTTEKLQAALDSKNDVQVALEEHGVEVTEDFSTYGPLIRSELVGRQFVEDHINDVSAHNPILVNATSSDGVAYTAEIDNLTELYPGLCLTMILDKTSASTAPTLNINGLGAKYFRQKLSTNTSTTTAGANDTWLVANKPFSVMYNGTYWVVELARTDANNIYGTVPIEAGGTGATTAADALANLGAAAATDLEGYLPLTGGMLSGNIAIRSVNGDAIYEFQRIANNSQGWISKTANAIQITTRNVFSDSSNERRLYLNDNNTALANIVQLYDCTNGTAKMYKIFGEHNKPVVQYNGNGSATSRTIDTGGIGYVCFVNGGGYCGIVGNNGGLFVNSSNGAFVGLKSSEAKYMSGVLTLTTTNSCVNANGTTFAIQAL